MVKELKLFSIFLSFGKKDYLNKNQRLLLIFRFLSLALCGVFLISDLFN